MKNIFLFVCLTLLSCSINKKNIIDKTPLVTMSRTGCYGTCPQYKISIYSDGLIMYNGTRFVKRLGCFKSKITSSQIDFIKSELRKISFFDLDSEYISPITDIPSVITEVTLDGFTHRVRDRLDGPRFLKDFYKRLDATVDSILFWKPCDLSDN